ncbi:hypothetical protein N431DRAFT_426350 [Stipitochalara longipes BDJ]|nr:hypothetical protein N431DRAFT_426350 [Stipitochalara longipes BDJ]
MRVGGQFSRTYLTLLVWLLYQLSLSVSSAPQRGTSSKPLSYRATYDDSILSNPVDTFVFVARASLKIMQSPSPLRISTNQKQTHYVGNKSHASRALHFQSEN